MKTLKYFIFFFSYFVSTGCPEMDYKENFLFENNSTKDVVLYLGGISRQFGGSLYPDTLLPDSKISGLFPAGVTRGYTFNKVPNADTLCLFIIDNAIVNTLSWEKIRDENIILRRYDLAITDFERLNWKISFPPNDAMKNIKMFPAYENN